MTLCRFPTGTIYSLWMTRLLNHILSVIFVLVLVSIARTEPPPVLWAVDVSPDGSLLATSGLPTQWLYDTDGLEPNTRGRVLPPIVGSAAVFSPDGNWLGVTGPPESTGLYHLDTGRFVHFETDEGARGIAWNHDGSMVAISGHDGAIRVWNVADDVAKPKLVYKHRIENGKSLTGVAWHPSENKVIAIGEFVLLYDFSQEEPIEPTTIVHRPNSRGPCLLLCAAWHPSGAYFVIGDYGNHDFGDAPEIQFRADDGSLKHRFERPGAEFRQIQWNPDGTRFAATSDALLIYDAKGALLHESKVDSKLWGLAWSPDGTTIYTTNMLGEFMRWESDATNPTWIEP